MHLGQGRHLHGIVGDEGGLDEGAFAELTEEFVNQFALTHRLVDLHTLRETEGANLFLGLAVAVEARLLLDGVEDGQTTEGRLERDHMAVNFHLRLAVDGGTDLLQHILREGHNPQQVLVRDIQFHTGELRVVGLVHTLITEILAHLVDTLEAAHDEALQIEFGGNTHVHILVQRIEVGDERTGRGTAGDVLQDRGIHLRIAGIVENAAQGADDGGTLQERLFHAGIHDEVDIALAVAQFGVVEGIVHLTVSIRLDHGQRLQTLAQQGQFHHVNADFARLRAEHVAFHADEVAQVEQLLKYFIIKILVLARTDGVALYVYLNATLRVLQFGKAGLAHDTLAHDTSGDAHHPAVFWGSRLAHVVAFLVFANDGQILKVVDNICAPRCDWKLCSRVGIDAHRAQFLQTLASADFLFA